MRLESIKENVEALWDSVTEGWHHLARSATHALTRFKSAETTNLPAQSKVDDELFLPTQSWGMLGGELFEDENRLIVRIEIPGMSKEDIDVQVHDNSLVIEGEKRFENETSEGRWRTMECAYGHFSRVVRLPVPVSRDETQASYKNGILRVELRKRVTGNPQRRSVKVS